MKKIISMLLIFVLALSLCACGDTVTEENVAEENLKIESCDLTVNTSQSDTVDGTSIYNQTTDNISRIYVHYKIKCNKPVADIRLKIESQWGRNEKTEEDFSVESDEILTAENDVWNTKSITLASNLYYWRITIYNGESEEILATKTIYTPYEQAQQTTVVSTEPEFHSFSELTESEKELYDLSCEAIIDYATTNHYEKFEHIFEAWSDESKVYLAVEYKKPYQMIWFAIDKETKEYIAHSNSGGIIPDGVGTADNNVLHDYFYVNKHIAEKMNPADNK